MKAMEMTGGWKAEENQTQVSPRLSTGLGNRSSDSHISTAAAPVRLIEQQKKKKQSSAIDSDRLQAHLWIGKQ
jgi:hypothetical protein